ncbi:hypothetical protein QBC34DRAFT_459618 [Podospora aff. communis PSN243]|uniref:BZIP domain-containing protein n=1 Tax=Podospora aff. communis PSN243 TaxID=3040156 RepID=A0AAV9GRP5_9PEZI|nr:hypothetical protein QBC34DRAFT_459618 [Podospora aff. communis PSN243]
MSANVFRFFRPPGEEKEDRSEKRRAQVRRAQQTYRLRKDQYARALEREIARLRSLEADLSRENERLREIVYAQKRSLRVAEKQVWGDLWDGLSESSEDVLQGPGLIPVPSSDCYRPHPVQPQGVVDLSDTSATGMDLESPCLAHIHAHTDYSSPASSQPLPTTKTKQPTTTNPDTQPPAEPPVNGHALTLSSYLLSLSPSPSTTLSLSPSPTTTTTPPTLSINTFPNLPNPSIPPPPPKNPILTPYTTHSPVPTDTAPSNRAIIATTLESTPRSILNKLLTLSTTFALEDEMTPVQAWERVRKTLVLDSSNGGLPSMELIRRVVDRLAGVVKCHG